VESGVISVVYKYSFFRYLTFRKGLLMNVIKSTEYKKVTNNARVKSLRRTNNAPANNGPINARPRGSIKRRVIVRKSRRFSVR
jgi:hypothetical protein